MLAFTFPGQGSQRSGMGRPWVDHPSWELVGEASELAGRDVATLLLDAPMDVLTLTANAQLATFVTSLVVLDAIERLGLAPAACAGHSLGEYSALVAAGALSFADGIRLVAERGAAMHDAASAKAGTMAAVLGMSDADADAACRLSDAEVWVANYNAPGQVVIAGTPDGVAVASAKAKELGARKVLPLPVAGAFHTPLMLPARDRLRRSLAEATFHAPEVPVVANVDARVHTGAEEWQGLLSSQLASPVRWRQSLETLAGRDIVTLVELGPGGVLSGLARRTTPELRAVSVAVPDDLDALMDAIAGPAVWNAASPSHQGEHLYSSERVVVSPAAGVFEPDTGLTALETSPLAAAAADPAAGCGEPGSRLAVGDRVGTVGTTDVRTPFAGQLVRWLAVRGERVVEGQPVAWVRTDAPAGPAPSRRTEEGAAL
ncbi:MAG: ACP S-malonyltransferase [Actinomycetota bacterium]|nr:ACP S-malonyltransferase [Actinomycetota bacterium]